MNLLFYYMVHSMVIVTIATHTACYCQYVASWLLLAKYNCIYHFDTSDQRESVLDISHTVHLSVRYKKYLSV